MEKANCITSAAWAPSAPAGWALPPVCQPDSFQGQFLFLLSEGRVYPFPATVLCGTFSLSQPILKMCDGPRVYILDPAY